MSTPYPAAFHGRSGSYTVAVTDAPTGATAAPMLPEGIRVPTLTVSVTQRTPRVIQPDEEKPWQDIDEDDANS